MNLTLKVVPATEPVTLAEAKLHCKVDGTDEDTLITALIVAAREQAESRTGRALITQQWELTLDSFPARIALPKPPLVSVQSVKYLDVNGTLQTLVSTEYQVVIERLGGYFLPAYGKAWPACRVQPDSIVVAFTAGYGAAADVPESIKLWMKMAIDTMYKNRGGAEGGQLYELPRDFFAALLDAYWIPTA